MHCEIRNFTVHPHILFSVIQSQAGTLAKALLEGVMNSIDAGASRITVHIDKETFSVRDDGRGFQSREEILSWFEQFGTPHTEGDAIYGKFRMGRGQMMAFAVNTWRTGTFCMNVDIKHQGLDYELRDKLGAVKGCKVEGKLYEPLSASALDEVITEFSSLVRYAQVPVSLNGRVISKRPELQSWDMETADAYIKTTRTGDLQVYNLGVLVRSYPQYHFGCGGTVVSKRALEVNFARNDILTHRCDTWRRISAYLKQVNLYKVASKSSLNSEERSFLAKQLAFGNLTPSMPLPVTELKLFTDAAGKHHSLRDLMSCTKLTVATEAQARTGARLQREGHALVLSEETLERFRVSSAAELVQVLRERTGAELAMETACFEDLALGCEETYQTHEDSELTVAELCVLEAVRVGHDKFHQWFATAERTSGQRAIRAGTSDVAEAWTDGASYVVLTRKVLARAADRGLAGCFELLMTLVHEYCHDTADLESHTHDLVFYNKHHDIVQYKAGKLMHFAEELHTRYQRLAKKAGLLPKEKPVSRRTAPASKSSLRAQREAVFAKSQMPLFND